jgi:hypothetical protein
MTPLRRSPPRSSCIGPCQRRGRLFVCAQLPNWSSKRRASRAGRNKAHSAKSTVAFSSRRERKIALLEKKHFTKRPPARSVANERIRPTFHPILKIRSGAACYQHQHPANWSKPTTGFHKPGAPGLLKRIKAKRGRPIPRSPRTTRLKAR